MSSWNSIKPGGYDRFELGSHVEMLDLKKVANNKWYPVRFVGDIYCTKQYWVKIKSQKAGIIQIPKLVLNWSPFKNEFTDDTCQNSKLAEEYGYKSPSSSFLTNVIDVREAEGFSSKGKLTPEEKESGFKDLSNERSRTPVKVVSINATVAQRIKDRISARDGIVPSDPERGYIVKIRYNSSKKGTEAWDVELGDEYPIEEGEYLIYDLKSAIKKMYKAAKEEPSNLEDVIIFNPDNKDGPGKKSDKKSSKRIADDEDDDEDLASFSGDDEDDEDDLPKAKKKKKQVDDDEDEDLPRTKAKGKKAKPVDDDEDDYEDDFLGGDDEEDEDEIPAKKKKKPVDDDEDEDDDDLPRTKAKGKKAKPVDDDEEDEDDLPQIKKKKPVDEDDEDDLPVNKKKKKPVDEDDDEDTEDLPRGKVKAKAGKKVTVKTKPVAVDDDEDDDDLPF